MFKIYSIYEEMKSKIRLTDGKKQYFAVRSIILVSILRELGARR
jgi:hypothetical protein